MGKRIPKIKEFHPETGLPICGAYTDRLNRFNEHYCLSDKLMDNGRCRQHGGKTPKGIASPHFIHGGRSDFLPQKLRVIYDAAPPDEEMLSVRDDIRLLDTLILAKLDKLEDNESAATWKQVDKLIRDVRKAYKKEDYGGLEDALAQMEGIADKKRLFYATEQEIKSDLALRSKLIETDQKIAYNGTHSFTAAQVVELMSAILDSVRRNVNDSLALNAIQNDYTRAVTSTQRLTASADS